MIDWTQIILTGTTTAIAAAIASVGTTISTLIVVRYFPRILNHVERKIKIGNGKNKKSPGESEGAS
jgi:hypothetical protein